MAKAAARIVGVAVLATATSVPSAALADGRETDRATAAPLTPDDEEGWPTPKPPSVRMEHDTRLGWVGVGIFTGSYLLADLFWSDIDCGTGSCGKTGLVFVPVAGPFLAQAEVSARIHDASMGAGIANAIFLWPTAVILSAAQTTGVVLAAVGFGAKTKTVYVPNEVSVGLDIRPGSLGLSGTW